MFAVFISAIGRLKKLKAAYDTHAALTVASGAHSAGSMAAQNKTAVDIDGGAIDGTPIGASAVETLNAKRVREARNDMGSATSFALDWAAYGMFKISPSGTFTVSHSNPPAGGALGQAIYVDVYFAGAAQSCSNWNCTWLTSAPTLASGHNWLYFFYDGTTVYGGILS